MVRYSRIKEKLEPSKYSGYRFLKADALELEETAEAP
jgi:hypothetical protein